MQTQSYQKGRADKKGKKEPNKKEPSFLKGHNVILGTEGGNTLENPSPDQHRLQLKRMESPFLLEQKATLLRSLQQTYGNQYVQCLLADSTPDTDTATRSNLPGLHNSGSPLEGHVRGEMERKFGTSLSPVRIHTDNDAADAARQIGARAFTRGQDIYFSGGTYRPETKEGKGLLAHELAHTIQQRGHKPGTQGALEIVHPDDPLERQADAVANEVISGRTTPGNKLTPLTRSSMKSGQAFLVQRQTKEPAVATPSGLTPEGDFVIDFGKLKIKKDEIDKAMAKGRFEMDISGKSLPGIKGKRLILNLEKNTGHVKGGAVTADLNIPFVRSGEHGGIEFKVDENGKASLHAKAKLEIPALNEPQVDISIEDGEISASATLSAEQIKPRGIPKLKIPQASATVGIAHGKLTGAGQVSLEYPNLAKGEFSVDVKDGEPSGKGKVELTPDYLKGVQADLQVTKGNLEGALTIPATKLSPPVPGLKITAGTITLAMKNSQLSGAGEGVAFGYQGLGEGAISFSITKDHLEGSGTLILNIPGLSPVKGNLLYQAGKLSGDATITADKFPKGLPIRGGTITVHVDEQGSVSGHGNVGIQLYGVGEGDLELGYENGILDIGADVALKKIPGLEEGHVKIGMKGGKLEGEGEIAVAPKQIPGLTGNLLVTYKDDRFSGNAKIGYVKEKFSGEVVLLLNQDEKGKMNISGSGDITAHLTDWLIGKVHIDVLPDATTKIAGQLKADDIELFPEKKADKELFNSSQHIPLWAILVAVIRLRGGVRAGVGPGKLRGVTAEGEFSTVPGEEPKFNIHGELFIPAYAEAYIAFGAGLGLDVVIGSLTGGIEAVGTAGIYGAVSVIPEIAYAGGNYSISGMATLAAGAKLKLGLQAWAEVEALWITVWSNEWKLGEWVWDVGPELGLQAQVNYVFGKPEPPTFEFKTSDIDTKRLVQDAMPKDGPKGSGARDALKNTAEWKGKLKEQKKDESKIPPALAEQQKKTPKPKEAPPKPSKKAPPPGALAKDPKKIKEEAANNLKGKAAPEKAKPVDKAIQEKWQKGMADLQKLADKSKIDPEDSIEIKKDLGLIKKTHGFKTLDVSQQGKEWVVDAEMNPKDTVKIHGVDPNAPDGSVAKPFPLKWPKRESAKYRKLYFGGRIDKYRKQDDITVLYNARSDHKDETGEVIKIYDPHSPKNLAGGKTIGLDPDWRTYIGKKVSPVKASTPGGRTLRDALESYGFIPSKEGMDMDHVIEIQMGGINDLKNMWPLESAENQHSGRTLSTLPVKMPDGKTKSMRDLKEDNTRKYYFQIDSFEF